jgi:hypothetical protein
MGWTPQSFPPDLQVVRSDDPSSPRPLGAKVVYWIGPLRFVNIELGDFWLNTYPDSVEV